MVAAKIKMNANGAHTFLEVSWMRLFNSYIADLVPQDRQGPFRHLRPFAFYILRCTLQPFGVRLSPMYVVALRMFF